MQDTAMGPISGLDILAIEEKRKQARSPEQIEKEEEARRERELFNISIAKAPTHSGNMEIYKHLKPILYDIKDLGKCDRETFDITIFKLNKELKHRLINATPGETAFHKYLEEIYKLVCAEYDKHSAELKARVKKDQNKKPQRENTLNIVESNLREMWEDQIIELELKAKQKSVFVEQDRSTWGGLPENDSLRSRQNIANEENELRKKVIFFDKEIGKLEEKAAPLRAEIDSRNIKLNADDIDESLYKNLRLEIDFRQAKLDKLTARIEQHEAAQDELKTQIDDLDKQMSILDCVIDKYALLREVGNWKKRKKRAIDRINKSIKERRELIQLRKNLNARWKQLTNSEDFCEPLCLKADGKLFFI